MSEKSKTGHLFCNKGIHQHHKFTLFSEYISIERKWQQKELQATVDKHTPLLQIAQVYTH